MPQKTSTGSNIGLDGEPTSFECLVPLSDGSLFKKYRNERTEQTWYSCTDCGMVFTELGETHDCSIYGRRFQDGDRWRGDSE